jgi:hypothetical protein
MLNNVAGLMGVSSTAVGDYQSIATVTVSTATSTITFSSIAATYSHLQIRGICNISGGDTEAKLTFNGDTTAANYATHQIVGDGATVTVTGAANSGFIKTAITNLTANIYGGAVIDILDYANTSKYKTVRTLAGVDLNGNGNMRFASGVWMNSANAVTSITLTASSGNFITYSSFALYGIK